MNCTKCNTPLRWPVTMQGRITGDETTTVQCYRCGQWPSKECAPNEGDKRTVDGIPCVFTNGEWLPAQKKPRYRHYTEPPAEKPERRCATCVDAATGCVPLEGSACGQWQPAEKPEADAEFRSRVMDEAERRHGYVPVAMDPGTGRSLDPCSATGSDLDMYAAIYGITRRGTKS